MAFSFFGKSEERFRRPRLAGIFRFAGTFRFAPRKAALFSATQCHRVQQQAGKHVTGSRLATRTHRAQVWNVAGRWQGGKTPAGRQGPSPGDPIQSLLIPDW